MGVRRDAISAQNLCFVEALVRTSPGNSGSELEYLAKTYNIDTFMIRDSDFFINVKRVKEICRLLIDKNIGSASQVSMAGWSSYGEWMMRFGDFCRKLEFMKYFFGF